MCRLNHSEITVNALLIEMEDNYTTPTPWRTSRQHPPRLSLRCCQKMSDTRPHITEHLALDNGFTAVEYWIEDECAKQASSSIVESTASEL